ncbi:MAG: tetratricopeptide repeat protein [Chloroflexota bacterium]
MAGDQKKFQAAMTQAEQLSQQEDWDGAIRAYRFALGEFPNNETAIIGFGRASLATGQIEFAQRAFQQALRINPTNHQAISSLGDIQERMGQLDAAAESYLRVGNIYLSRGDHDSAIDFWTRATKLSPDQIEAHRRLADLLADQGQTLKSARQFLALASIHQRHQDTGQANQAIEQAEQLMPGNPGIAAAYEALHSGTHIRPDQLQETPDLPPESAPSFEEEYDDNDGLLSSSPDAFEDDPFAINEFELDSAPQRGLLESTQQEALSELANIIFEEDSNPNVLLIMSAIDLQRQENFAEAAENYQKAVNSGIQRPAIYFNLGLLLKELGQYNEAVAMLKRASEDPTYKISAQYALGETYRVAEDVPTALHHYIDIIKTIDFKTVNQDKVTLLNQQYVNLADSYLANGDNEKINTFITSIGNFFSRPDWQKKAFEVRKRMDSTSEDSVMSLAEYLESPQTEIVITGMSLTKEYMDRNLLMTASEECLRAIQRAPSYLPLHIRLADILLKQDQHDIAITKYLGVADLYQVRGVPDQAVGVYEKVLKLAPMDVMVRSKLIELYTAHDNLQQAAEQYIILGGILLLGGESSIHLGRCFLVERHCLIDQLLTNCL